MVAKAEDLVANLKSSDSATRLKAVRDVRNQVIGNKHRKRTFIKLELIPTIVQLLDDKREGDIAVQCATVAGSLARVDEESARALSKAGGIGILFQLLESKEEAVVEAGLRALNFYFEVSRTPCNTLTRSICLDITSSKHCVLQPSKQQYLHAALQRPTHDCQTSASGVLE